MISKAKWSPAFLLYFSMIMGCGERGAAPDGPCPPEDAASINGAAQAAVAGVKAKIGDRIFAALLDDDEAFSQLAAGMDRQCRAGNSSQSPLSQECESVVLTHIYHNDYGYCGPGVVKGSRCWGGNLRNPGSELNRLCHAHDRCLARVGVEKGLTCAWTPITSACDDDFFAAAAALTEAQCGEDCRKVIAIAHTIDNTRKRDEQIFSLCTPGAKRQCSSGGFRTCGGDCSWNLRCVGSANAAGHNGSSNDAGASVSGHDGGTAPEATCPGAWPDYQVVDGGTCLPSCGRALLNAGRQDFGLGCCSSCKAGYAAVGPTYECLACCENLAGRSSCEP